MIVYPVAFTLSNKSVTNARCSPATMTRISFMGCSVRALMRSAPFLSSAGASLTGCSNRPPAGYRGSGCDGLCEHPAHRSSVVRDCLPLCVSRAFKRVFRGLLEQWVTGRAVDPAPPVRRPIAIEGPIRWVQHGEVYPLVMIQVPQQFVPRDQLLDVC